MCIAIAKKIHSKCPSLDTLHNCWESNPDGAGFAFNDAGRVVIKKGFMTWGDFKAAWLRYSKRHDFDNRGVLIHFRISTHGGTNPQNTHPFPVISDTGMMQKSECVCDYAAIHNGVISLTSSQAYKEHTVSDTLVFIRDYLSLIAQNKAWFKRRSNIELIDLLIDAPSSKMAILNGRGEIIHTNGFVEDNVFCTLISPTRSLVFVLLARSMAVISLATMTILRMIIMVVNTAIIAMALVITVATTTVMAGVMVVIAITRTASVSPLMQLRQAQMTHRFL